MKVKSRLAVLITVAATGLGLTTLPAAATASSAPQWVSRLHVANSTGYAAAVSPDGSTVFVTGVAKANVHTTHGVTVADNAATGAQLWQTEDTANGQFDSVAVSPDGSTVFVTGYGRPAGGKGFYDITVAYDAATGATLWTQMLGKEGTGGSVTVAPDGSAVYIAAHDTCGPPLTSCYVIAAYNPTTGASLWTDQLPVNGITGSIAVAPDGATLYVTGSAIPKGLADDQYSTMAINAATGANVWTTNYAVAGNAQAGSVAVSPSGSTVFVTGDVQGSGYRTIAYSAATGTRLWGPKVFSVKKVGYAGALAVSPDGTTLYVGGTVGRSDDSYGTVAYSTTTGAKLWQAVYTGFGGQESDLAVSPDGSTVYVTGNSASAPSTGHPEGIPQYTTLSYNASTGAQQWVRHFGDVAEGASRPFPLAVSPDSSTVYVSGQSVINLTTVAYGS